MEALLFYAVVGAFALGRYLLVRGRPRFVDDWQNAVAECGLHFAPATDWLRRDLVAESEQLRVTFTPCSDPEQMESRRIVVARRERSLQPLWIHVPLPGHFDADSLPRGGTATGDRAFDAAVTAHGPPEHLLAVLDAATRSALIALARNGGVAIAGGEVSVTVVERHLEMSRQRFLAQLIALSDRFHSPIDIPAALARNARQDPHPAVRGRNLTELARLYREAPGTTELLRAALDDAAPPVWILAARELGEEGRERLLRFAEDPEAEDADVAAAIVALGPHFPVERIEPTLKPALRRRRVATCAACIERLGVGDVPEAAGTLARILDVERGALAVAAANVLGILASVEGERRLIAALVRPEAEVAAEVARAVVAALARSGSIAAVPALRALAEGDEREREIRRAARQAIGAIQSRAFGAERGQLSLAPTLGGSISLAPEQSGQISLADDPVGRLSPRGRDSG